MPVTMPHEIGERFSRIMDEIESSADILCILTSMIHDAHDHTSRARPMVGLSTAARDAASRLEREVGDLEMAIREWGRAQK